MALTPSDRIRLILEIGRLLGGEDWTVIDLTLRQFRLPITDDWRGDNRPAYVMEMIDGGDDDALLALGRHMGYEYGTSPPHTAPSFWTSGYFRLFLSHLAEHRKFAGEIQDALLTFGISSFVAHNDIEPTTEWQNEIESALATCDGMLALLHPAFHESNWTDQEIGYGMGRQLLIVAVHLGTEPYGFIGRIQAIQGGGRSAGDLAQRQFDILRKNPKTRTKMAEAAVEHFGESSSFEIAKERMSLLEKLEYWDESLSKRARSALQDNGQISDAWGVRDRLERLINSKGKVAL